MKLKHISELTLRLIMMQTDRGKPDHRFTLTGMDAAKAIIQQANNPKP